MRRIKFFLLLWIFASIAFAQLSMGEWHAHNSYDNVTEVAQSENRVFAVGNGSLFAVDKDDYEIKTYSTLEGLCGAKISFIKYSSTEKLLLIACSDGNIDLLTDEDAVVSMPDILRKDVAVTKMPTDVVVDGSFAYVLNGFGLVKINLKKREFSDTYNVSKDKKLSVSISKDSIFVLGDTSIFSGKKSDDFLGDPSHWKEQKVDGCSKIVCWNNDLILLKENGDAVRRSNGAVLANGIVDMFVTEYGSLVLRSATTVRQFSANGDELATIVDSEINNLVLDENSPIYWKANGENGLQQMNAATGEVLQKIKPNCPSQNAYNLKFSGGRLFAVNGIPRSEGGTDFVLPGAIMIYENGLWKNITSKDVVLACGCGFYSICDIAVDPNDNTHFFASSFREGIYEFRNDEYVKYYDRSNSSLYGYRDSVHASGWCERYLTIGAIEMDKNSSLWGISEYDNSAIKYRKSDGSWYQFSYSSLKNITYSDKMYITSDGKKWTDFPRTGGGIFVLDTGNESLSRSNHKYKLFSSFTDTDEKTIGLQTNFVLAEDHTGNVWIGNNSGVFYFSLNNTFASDLRVKRPKIARNDGTNLADYLLDGQQITAIVVDGGNRKWIGTNSSGIYLVSDDGLLTLAHFTVENSPLLSNKIISMAMNQKTGELFIATSNGLISYQTDATESASSLDEIEVYPNPVRENYSGPISFVGLIDGTTVKVTDAAGNLVYQTESNGGVATWDGKYTSGKRAATGVYFVMGSVDSSGDTKTGIGKFVLVR